MIFHPFYYCFHQWLWTSKCLLGTRFRDLRRIHLLSKNLSIFYCYIRCYNIRCSYPSYQWLLLSDIYLKHCITTGIYLFKVKNGITKTTCEICSKLTIKPPEWRHQWLRSGAFLVNYEQLSQIVLVFTLLGLS